MAGLRITTACPGRSCRAFLTLLGDADLARAKRAFESMMEMKRIDIAALERAAGI